MNLYCFYEGLLNNAIMYRVEGPLLVYPKLNKEFLEVLEYNMLSDIVLENIKCILQFHQ